MPRVEKWLSLDKRCKCAYLYLHLECYFVSDPPLVTNKKLWDRINGKDLLEDGTGGPSRFFDVTRRREAIELPEEMQQIGK